MKQKSLKVLSVLIILSMVLPFVQVPTLVQAADYDHVYYAGGANASDTVGDGSQDKPYATLSKVLSVITAAGNYKIVISGDISDSGTCCFIGNFTTKPAVNITLQGPDDSSKTAVITRNNNNFYLEVCTNSSLTIKSGGVVGNLIFDGNKSNYAGTTSLFRVDNGASLNAENIVIQNCGTGAVRNAGTATITDSTFQNNNNTSSGGAIYNAGTINLEADKFISNSAGSGGAISSGGTLNLIGGTFQDNTSDYGGAIYDQQATMNISGAINMRRDP